MNRTGRDWVRVLAGETVDNAFDSHLLADELLFFLGPDTVGQDGEDQVNKISPIRFIRPGETGLSDMEPLFGCNATEDIVFRPGAAP